MSVFEKAGSVIKKFAKIYFIVAVVLLLIIGLFVLVVLADENPALSVAAFVLIIGVGGFSAWFAAILLYAYGEITDRMVRVDEMLHEHLPEINQKRVQSGSPGVTHVDLHCEVCGTANVHDARYCSFCGNQMNT